MGWFPADACHTHDQRPVRPYLHRLVVGRHTKAWIIPGTEDLRPYINGKTLVIKWLGTLVGFPVLAAILAGVMQLIGA